MNLPLIEFQQVSKAYGPFLANDALSFSVEKGTIHGIIGENGAGKTTAMKLLFGLESPSDGKILMNGNLRDWTNPRGAMARGLGMVHQHFMLSPTHTALDNVILGREIHSESLFQRMFAPIHRSKLKSELQTLAESVGFIIPWDSPVCDLAVGTQQQLEIIKLLHAGVEVMIFDEPTAVLSPEETTNFLKMLKDLKQKGRTIIVITHKLKEVKAITDHITVFRRGKSVASAKTSEVSIQEMADLMVGRHVQLGDIDRPHAKLGDPLIKINDLTIPAKGKKNLLNHLTLEVRSGQIVGIAGVEGSGQNELFRFICSPSAFAFKNYAQVDFQNLKVEILGQEAKHWTQRDVRQQSIAIVPADRLREAVLPSESLLENDLLGHDEEFAKFTWTGRQYVDRREARQKLLKELKQFDVRPQNPDAVLKGLSGGNQQKFVMARELSRHPKLILCSQPTRGVDVGSIEQIHGELLARRNQGSGVLLISSQLEELMALSDVIHVMFEGSIVATFERGSFDEGRIGVAMGGGK